MECVNCGSTKTSKNLKGYEQWYNGTCKKCYDKLVYNPKRVILNRTRRFTFKGRRITAKQDIRQGICKQCGKIGGTDIHHIEYDESDPLKHTIELCNSCHATETLKSRYN